MGPVFNGSSHSLGGNVTFDDGAHRAVAVDAAAIEQALRLPRLAGAGARAGDVIR